MEDFTVYPFKRQFVLLQQLGDPALGPWASAVAATALLAVLAVRADSGGSLGFVTPLPLLPSTLLLTLLFTVLPVICPFLFCAQMGRPSTLKKFENYMPQWKALLCVCQCACVFWRPAQCYRPCLLYPPLRFFMGSLTLWRIPPRLGQKTTEVVGRMSAVEGVACSQFSVPRVSHPKSSHPASPLPSVTAIWDRFRLCSLVSKFCMGSWRTALCPLPRVRPGVFVLEAKLSSKLYALFGALPLHASGLYVGAVIFQNWEADFQNSNCSCLWYHITFIGRVCFTHLKTCIWSFLSSDLAPVCAALLTLAALTYPSLAQLLSFAEWGEQ